MTRDLNERKNVFESGGFSQQFKSSCGHTATDAATKCVLPISLFFAILELRILPSKKNIEGPN